MNNFLLVVGIIIFSILGIGVIFVIGILVSSLGFLIFEDNNSVFAHIIFNILIFGSCIVASVRWVVWLYKSKFPPVSDYKTLKVSSDTLERFTEFLQKDSGIKQNPTIPLEIDTTDHSKEQSSTPKKGSKKAGRSWIWGSFLILVILTIILFEIDSDNILTDTWSEADVIALLLVIALTFHLFWPRHTSIPKRRINSDKASFSELSSKDIPPTEKLETDYQKQLALYKKLRQQIAVYDEKLSFIELGVYEPHFDFGDSDQYKVAIKNVRDKQKKMVIDKESCDYPDTMTLDGSHSKGMAMMNRQMRLTLRAFNNECEAAIANTRWNNVVAMEKRIMNSAKQINAANESLKMLITDKFVALKLEELYLTHEYREQKKLEKDERAELARQEREEKALLKAAENAAKKEDEKKQALEQARAEADAGSATEEMLQRIANLEQELKEAHAETERSRSLAEQTNSGYVYIISNVGAFGEDIVKIGLTRRLNPDDRVKELSDASVPFGFDTHAMIYSDSAPELETALHLEFTDRRVNMANLRKEFFRVSLEEVEQAVQRLAPDATFFKDREAQEWHETLARRNEVLSSAENDFPTNLWE